MSTVRPSVLAGTWYPAAAPALSALVDGFLAGGDPGLRPAGRPLIGLAPHAGYDWSGPVAGRLYGTLDDRPPRRLIILAPSHRARLRRPALSGATAFATPLGPVTVDTAATARLVRTDAFVMDDHAHRQEHAIEIQLPLVQRRWPDGGPVVVPVLVPPLDREHRAAAASALAAELDDATLLVISTDLTHYGVSYGFTPFADRPATDLAAAIESLDAGALLRVLAGDGEGLLRYGRATGITMCGLEAAALALACGVPEGHRGALLGYARSGDRDADYAQSVSYAAALISAGDASTDGGTTPEGTEGR